MKSNADKTREQKPDRHLEAPAEANRDKHANFMADEDDLKDQQDKDGNGPLLSKERNPNIKEDSNK
jgi:hypothetical protein